MKNTVLLILTIILFAACMHSSGKTSGLPNKTSESEEGNSIISRFTVPEGYIRVQTRPGTFGYFLQNFALKPEGEKVFYYNGFPKFNQRYHCAVLNIDVGNRDLQQCADAVMRLRGEFLFSEKRFDEVAFNFVSDGKPRYFLEYSSNDTSYNSFRKYMDYIFNYANTRSLYDQMEKVVIDSIQIGDVLIQKKNPYGHAVIVVDMAVHKSNGSKIYLIAQSYMPAQSIHVLINTEDEGLSPWYKISPNEQIITPEWDFTKNDLRRFVDN